MTILEEIERLSRETIKQYSEMHMQKHPSYVLANHNIALIKALKLAIEQRDGVHSVCIGYTQELIDDCNAEIEKLLSEEG